MKYPVISKWVTYGKTDNGEYYIYDEMDNHGYLMYPQDYEILVALDGKTDPYTIPSSLTKEEIGELLESFKNDRLIRNSRIALKSRGSILITLWFVEGTPLQIKVSSIVDRLLSVLWFPVFLSGLLFMIAHSYDLFGPDLFTGGLIFGVVTGMIFHEAGHAVACLHCGGKVYEFGVGINLLIPIAYTLINMDYVKSRRKRAHINAAGIEGNILLAGICLYLACVIPGGSVFMIAAAIANTLLALLNLIFIKDADGMKIISEYIGCDNLFVYAKGILFSRKKRQKLCREGINGWVTLCVCCIGFVMQIGLPFLIAFHFVFFFF